MFVKKIEMLHSDHGVSEDLIFKALKRINSLENFGENIIDFHTVIGFSNLVEVNENNEFYELYRGNRQYPSRFVKNRLPIPRTKLVVIWKRVKYGYFKVITAFFSNQEKAHCPDEPGNIKRKLAKGIKYSEEELRLAKEFWSKHAFVEIPGYPVKKVI